MDLLDLTTAQQFQLERIKRSVESATPQQLREIVIEMTVQETRRVNLFKKWMKTGDFVEELTQNPSYSFVIEGDSDAV